MKKLLPIILLVCLFLHKPASADVVGSEITYACTSTPGVFEVTLVLYIDCSGLPLCSGSCGSACSHSLSIKGADPGFTSSNYGSFSLQLVSVRDMDPQNGCPNAKSNCTNRGCNTAGTFTPGFERYEFKGLANIGPSSGIPSNCCNVRFVYEICCRDGSIQTGAANQSLYVDAVINRCLSTSPCNGSPVFTNDPYGVICSGQSFQYNSGAVDPNHDSLSFAFAPALQSYGSSVTYTSPFSYDKPLPWTGSATAAFPSGIHCDAQTGDIRLTPGNASGTDFYGILALEVKQWKTINGVPTVIGITRRETETIILGNCLPNNPPSLTTSPSDGNNPKMNWEVCEGSQLCFDIGSLDHDTLSTTMDSTFMGWDGNLSALGATFTPNFEENIRHMIGPREVSYKFCWTPPAGSASGIPYILVVKTNDSKCPIPGRSSQAFSITVKKLPTLSLVQYNLHCGKFSIGYSNSTPNITAYTTKLKIAKAPFDYTFALGADSFQNMAITPELSFTSPGKYFIQLQYTNNTCSAVLYDTLLIDSVSSHPLNHNTLMQDISCTGANNGEIHTQGTGGIPPYAYRMGTSGNYTSDSVFRNLLPNTYTISIRDNSLCVTTFTQIIHEPAQLAGIGSVTNATCSGKNNGKILAAGMGGTSPYTYKLQTSSTYGNDSLFTNLAAGSYTINIRDKNGCAANITRMVESPFPLLSTTQFKAVSCFGAADGTSIIHTNGGTKPYQFKSGINGILSADSLFANLAAGTHQFYIIDNATCADSVMVTIQQPQQILASLLTVNPSCFGKPDGKITVQPTQGIAPFQYAINGGTFGSNNTFTNLAHNTHSVTVKDSSGCLATFNTTLTDPPQVVAGNIMGPIISVLNSTEIYSVAPQAGLNYVWTIQKGTILSGQNTSAVNVSWDTIGTGQVDIAVYSDSTCGDTAKLSVNVGMSGLNESARLFGLEVFPNPTSGLLNITLKTLPQDHSLKLYDIHGRLIVEQDLKLSQQLNLETLPQGIYLLKVGDYHGQIIKK